MFGNGRRSIPLGDDACLRVMFITTSMPVGGAETLLLNLIRRMDRRRFAPELCCLKELGPLGEELAREIPVFEKLLHHKYDVPVWSRLTRLLRRRRIDVVVTTGTGGDRMFWGRLAAWRGGVPVIVSWLHTTGLPDHAKWPSRLLHRLNRFLHPLNDAFIALARSHGRYLVEAEGCPPDKVCIVHNGIDVHRFRPLESAAEVRAKLGIDPTAPLVGILAALRPEKNHELFLKAAALVRRRVPQARFLIIGDGPQRALIEALRREFQLDDSAMLLGTRADVPELLSSLDVLLLTSHTEASPVSLMEAMACGKPVVATRVGSIPDLVDDGRTGFLVPPGDARALADRVVELFGDPQAARNMGRRGRHEIVATHSLDQMTARFESLLEQLHARKCGDLARVNRPVVQTAASAAATAEAPVCR